MKEYQEVVERSIGRKFIRRPRPLQKILRPIGSPAVISPPPKENDAFLYYIGELYGTRRCNC